MKTGGPASVAWFKNDKPLSSGITAPSATKSVFTAGTASKDDNGEYQCKVTYGKIGTANSAKVTQYVRYVTPAKTVYGVQTKDIDITCTFYGDALGATSWFKDASTTALKTEGQYTLTAGTYKSQMRTDTLKIKTLTSTNDGVYTCKATYTAGSKETSSKQTLSVIAESLTVTATRSPADQAVDVGTKVSFTCTYTNKVMGADDGTITLAWKLNDEAMSGVGQKFETTADHFKNGIYKCGVTYGKFGDISGSNTLLVRSVEHTANVYAMHNAKASLTCKAYGDEPTSITWNDGTKDYINSATEVTDSTYGNYFVESVFSIATATSKAYTCKVVYSKSSPSKTITQTTTVKVLNAICEFFILFLERDRYQIFHS